MLVNGTHLNFEYLEIYENHYAGVYLEYFKYLYFANSTLTHNHYEGLYKKKAWEDSYYVYISTYGKFEHLNVSYNGKDGISLRNVGEYGSICIPESYLYIAHSVISHNQGHGIYVDDSYNASVFNNTVEENTGFGIFFDDVWIALLVTLPLLKTSKVEYISLSHIGAESIIIQYLTIMDQE